MCKFFCAPAARITLLIWAWVVKQVDALSAHAQINKTLVNQSHPLRVDYDIISMSTHYSGG
jgi:hypothetical protein